MTLPKPYRLADSKKISLLIKKGQFIRTSLFTAKKLPSFSGNPQIVVMVSKKIEKTAVKRNRIRRRITEAFRKNIKAEGKEKYSFLLSVFPSADVLKADFSAIEKCAHKIASFETQRPRKKFKKYSK